MQTVQNTAVETTQVAVDQLKPWARNARKHSKKQIGQIAESIAEFGFTNPVLIDDGHNILAGHGRVAAALQLGLNEIPCAVIGHMTDAQKRAYVLADNKIAANADWDEELLALELGELADLDLGFDLELTGFSLPEIDSFVELGTPELANDPKADQLPEVAPRRVELGTFGLWGHTVWCVGTAWMNGSWLN